MRFLASQAYRHDRRSGGLTGSSTPCATRAHDLGHDVIVVAAYQDPAAILEATLRFLIDWCSTLAR
jgi:hypothetical protein